METRSTLVESLFKSAEDYSKTTIELLKLKAIDKSADVVSSFVSRFVILVVEVMSILIISIGMAFWIGSLAGKIYFGFFIIGGIYALVAILLHLFRHPLIKLPVNNSIIHQLLKQ
jgi:hypothetical protein